MKPEVTSEQLVISSSPHAHEGSSVDRIMWDVVISLSPALMAAIFFFGLEALRLVGVCVATCLLTEWGCRKLMKRPNTLSDWSAVVTGILLAFNLPPSSADLDGRGGLGLCHRDCKAGLWRLGYNPFNPALAARAFMLISFTGAMTTWSKSTWPTLLTDHWVDTMTAASRDAMTTATPLGLIKEAIKSGEGLPTFTSQLLENFFFGNMNGCIGETSALALLLGAAYLLYRKVITWHIPVAYILTVFVYAFVLRHFWPEDLHHPLGPCALRRTLPRRPLHGHRHGHLARHQARDAPLRTRLRCDHDAHPNLQDGCLSRGRQLCDFDHECVYTPH
jgi:Na+-translocating ferredoxin:NAD+ oxidoreductase subunit D